MYSEEASFQWYLHMEQQELLQKGNWAMPKIFRVQTRFQTAIFSASKQQLKRIMQQQLFLYNDQIFQAVPWPTKSQA